MVANTASGDRSRRAPGRRRVDAGAGPRVPRQRRDGLQLPRPCAVDPGISIVSDTGCTVGVMDDLKHWHAWLARYGDDYATDPQRRAAYRDALTNLAELKAVFGRSGT